jgi:hypothetical protein
MADPAPVDQARWCSPSTGKDRLDVDDGCAVEGLEVVDEHPEPVDRGDLGAPSNPCLGAPSRSTRDDSTYPTGLTS